MAKALACKAREKSRWVRFPLSAPNEKDVKMTTVLFVGDSHGNLAYMRHALKVAQEASADLVVQVGDFGFWPSKSFSSIVDNDFTEGEMPLWVIRGNHDFTGDAYQYLKTPTFDPGLTLISDGWRTIIDNVSIGFLGGAVSVDQDSRLVGRSWWADEVTSDDNIDAALFNGPVDVWVTHDSVYRPEIEALWNFTPWIEDQLKTQNDKMRKAFHALKPRLHIHGHWHCRYQAETHYGRVIGLDYENNSGLLLVDFNDGETVVG